MRLCIYDVIKMYAIYINFYCSKIFDDKLLNIASDIS